MTARIVARGRKEIAAGGPLIPLAFANRMADGESPIRVLRDWRGMTQADLADKAGIGQGYISDLENGARKGTTTVMKAIAQALGVPLDFVV